MSDPSELRVSDQDRERVAREIREHFAAGRLTDDELNDRIQAAYQARTESELSALRADLPQLPATRKQQRAELAQRRRSLQRRLLQQSGGALVAFAICTAIWVASGATGPFWPVWVALVAVIPFVRGGWQLYGRDPELDHMEDELARRDRERARRPTDRGRHRRRRY